MNINFNFLSKGLCRTISSNLHVLITFLLALCERINETFLASLLPIQAPFLMQQAPLLDRPYLAAAVVWL